MATTKSYTLGTGCTLTNLSNHKGEVTHAIYGKLHVPGMKRAITTTYDILNDRLFLREWYLFSDDQLAAIRAMLTEFFTDYAATLTAK